MKTFLFASLLTSLFAAGPAWAGHVWPGGGGEAEQNVAFVWTTFDEWLDACRVDSACSTLLPEAEARAMRTLRQQFSNTLQSRADFELDPLPGHFTLASFGVTTAGDLAVLDDDLYVGDEERPITLAESLGRLLWSLAPESLASVDVAAWELAAQGLVAGRTTSVGFHSADHPELRWFLNDRKDLWLGDGASLAKISPRLPRGGSCAAFGAELVQETYANPRWLRSSPARIAGLPGAQGDVDVTARCRGRDGQAFNVRGTLLVDLYFEVSDGPHKITNPQNLEWQSHPQWSLTLREDLLQVRYEELDSSPVSANN